MCLAGRLLLKKRAFLVVCVSMQAAQSVNVCKGSLPSIVRWINCYRVRTLSCRIMGGIAPILEHFVFWSLLMSTTDVKRMFVFPGAVRETPHVSSWTDWNKLESTRALLCKPTDLYPFEWHVAWPLTNFWLENMEKALTLWIGALTLTSSRMPACSRTSRVLPFAPKSPAYIPGNISLFICTSFWNLYSQAISSRLLFLSLQILFLPVSICDVRHFLDHKILATFFFLPKNRPKRMGHFCGGKQQKETPVDGIMCLAGRLLLKKCAFLVVCVSMQAAQSVNVCKGSLPSIVRWINCYRVRTLSCRIMGGIAPILEHFVFWSLLMSTTDVKRMFVFPGAVRETPHVSSWKDWNKLESTRALLCKPTDLYPFEWHVAWPLTNFWLENMEKALTLWIGALTLTSSRMPACSRTSRVLPFAPKSPAYIPGNISHFICTSFSNLLTGHFIQALFDEDLSIGVSHCFSLQHLMQVLQFSAVIEMASDPLLDPFAGFRP